MTGNVKNTEVKRKERVERVEGMRIDSRETGNKRGEFSKV